MEHFILGCSGLAGLFHCISPETADEIVAEAVQRYGITKFDTAPHYGCGLGEERLGRALNKLGATHDVLFVHTKVGRLILPVAVTELDCEAWDIEYGNLPGPSNVVFPDSPPGRTPVFDFTCGGIRKSYVDSLQRLAISEESKAHVAGLRLHDFDTHFDIACTEALPELIRLREEQKICGVSIGVNSARVAYDFLCRVPEGSLNSIMLANQWNLLDHPIEAMEIFRRCEELSIEIHIAGLFASGALVGRDSYMYASIQSREVQHRIQQWRELCEVAAVALPLAAIAFALRIRSVFPKLKLFLTFGVGSVSELAEVVTWYQSALADPVPASFWTDAVDRGLLADYAQL